MRVVAVSILLLVALPLRAEQSAEDLAKKAEEIRRLEQDQLVAQEKTAEVTERLNELQTALQANQADDGQGKDLTRMGQQLKKVGDDNIGAAAQHLRQAWQQTDKASSHLNDAQNDINAAVGVMKTLVQKSATEGAALELIAELRAIIAAQEKLNTITKALQKAASTEQLALDQNELATRTGQFQDSLIQHRDQEKDPVAKASFDRAVQISASRTIREDFANASHALQNKDTAAAIKNQDSGTDGLKEILRVLETNVSQSVSASALHNLRELIASVLADQVAARTQTEKVAAASFAKSSTTLLPLERNVETGLTAAVAQLDSPGMAVTELTRSALNDAGKAIKDAENGIQSGKQPDSIAAQKAAEESLKRAIDQLDQQIAAAKVDDKLADKIEKELEDAKELAKQIERLKDKEQALKDASQTMKPEDAAKKVDLQNAVANDTKAEEAKAAEDAPIKEELQKAEQAMAAASSDLQKSDPQQAQTEQQKAVGALEQAQQKANDTVSKLQDAKKEADAAEAMKDVASQLGQMAQQEGVINQQTQQAAQAGAKANPQDLAKAQQELQNQAQAAAAAMQDQAEADVKKALDDAAQAMQQAAQNLNRNNLAAAQKSEEQAQQALQQAQAKAEAKAAEMGQQAAADAAKAEGQEPGKEMAQAQPGEQGKGQEMAQAKGPEQGKGQEKGQGQEKGSGQEKGQGKGEEQGKGKGEEKGKGEGKEEGKGEGESEQGGKGEGQSQGAKGDTANGTAADAAGSGNGPADRKSSWSSAANRDRSTVNQKYLNQLPLEYRDVLGDYFEAVSTIKK